MARPPLDIGEWGSINRVKGSAYRVNCWFRDGRGELVRVERSSKQSFAAAERALMKVLKVKSAAAVGDSVLTSESTIADVAKVYFDELEANGQKSGTIKNYRSRYANYIEKQVGGVKLRQITVSRLTDVIRAANDSPHTAKNIRVVLMNIFAVAVRHDAIRLNLAESTRPVKLPRGKVVALRPEKVQGMLRLFEMWDEVHGTDMYDSLLMLASTGARTGELLAWEYPELSYDAAKDRMVARVTGTLVEHHDTGELFKQEVPKSIASERGLTLPKTTSDRMLARFRERGSVDVVFPSRNDKFQWPNNYRRRWNAITADTEFEGVTPKAFRKAVATHLNRAAGREAAQAQLGHESSDVTMEYYIELEEAVADFSLHLESLVNPG